jgi:D-alanyl-D-alanine endopeptidase (penicillin-binding protein 7)
MYQASSGRHFMRWSHPFCLALAVALAALTSAGARAADAGEAAEAPAAVQHRVVVAKRAPIRTHARAVAATRHARRTVVARAPVHLEPPKPSFGQIAGLHGADDPLALRSSVALVLDQDTHEVLLSKNSQAVLPIASITKLMTALVISEARQSLEEPVTITTDDIDTEKGSRSRLIPGTRLSRGEMLHLALMSSENRAANALGRNYPGGMAAFVPAMNAKAKALGMNDTHYVEPTGLSSENQSSARDLAVLVNAAHQVPLLREYSTTPELQVAVGHRNLQFHTTNRLVMNPSWDIGVQKTGYITEAGQCLVMQAQLAGRKLIMVLLDSAGKYSRIADAERIRKWLAQTAPLHNTAAPVRAAVAG